MTETIKDRLVTYLKTKRINNSEFARLMGVSNAYVSSMRKGPSPEVVALLKEKFDDLNIEWLMTGEGSMIKQLRNVYAVKKTDSTFQPSNGVPFFDTEAASCGYLAGFGAALDANNPNDIIVVPGLKAKEGDFFLRTRGRSMIDTLHPEFSIPEGSMVLVRKWSDDYVQWGEIYCVATPEGYAIKRLMPSTDTNKITLQSADQLNYPSYEIAKTNILAIGKVLGILTYKEI